MTIGGTQALDSLGMVAATLDLPDQVAAAADRSSGLSGLPNIDDVNSVVVLGMGGSGIAGDLVAAVAGPFMPVPVVVAKSYELPAFVGEGKGRPCLRARPVCRISHGCQIGSHWLTRQLRLKLQ